VWKRLGKRSATSTSGRSSSSVRGACSLGAGDGTVVTQASMMGDRRGVAGMSSRVMWS